MSNPDTCPECGAEQIDKYDQGQWWWRVEYSCESGTDESGEFHQHWTCRIHQLEQQNVERAETIERFCIAASAKHLNHLQLRMMADQVRAAAKGQPT